MVRLAWHLNELEDDVFEVQDVGVRQSVAVVTLPADGAVPIGIWEEAAAAAPWDARHSPAQKDKQLYARGSAAIAAGLLAHLSSPARCQRVWRMSTTSRALVDDPEASELCQGRATLRCDLNRDKAPAQGIAFLGVRTGTETPCWRTLLQSRGPASHKSWHTAAIMAVGFLSLMHRKPPMLMP